ncbi:hypothetical protein LWI29_005639 [Acer saccharum]|uniref:Uncharacterized protein n=1 Tax=Acer saccharum TaxID=4024 RepID=A0AA39VLY0_ACESA|nr:hypothetical protein LWI29_005639 [Acer saccharum]
MCLCLIWKLKGYGAPTPREIRHFYTLRQAGNGGTYFLLSSSVENWILEGVANPGQVEVSSDEKKKGFIWGFPTSNKRWKNSWFLLAVSGAAMRLPAVAVTSRDTWFVFLAICDFDTVCDLQARAVKNSEAASKRHAAGLANEGIASSDGDDHSDGEEAGDVSKGGAESGRPPMRAEVAVNTPAATAIAATPAAATPSRKGKEKVGASGGVGDIPDFNADVPETPHDPASDLAPRVGRGKRPAETTPNRAARPPKRASRVVQYVVSSDEESAGKPALAETPIQTDVRKDNAEGTNAVVPPPEEVDELNIPASTPPRTASPPVAMGESNVSSYQLRPSGQPESVDRLDPSKQTGTSASGSGFAHEAPPVGPTEAGEGTMSFSDFSATEICSHLINNNVYIGEGWEHVKSKSCNIKMEFFFNCHSLMMSELADNYKYGNKASREIKRLREQTSILAVEKLSAEESHAQQLAQLRESSDGHLSARLAAEDKLSAAEEEICSLKELLSASQESFAARLEAEQVAEEAKEKAEHEAADLRNQLSSRELIFDNLKAVLEAEAIDRFKRSPAYDALLLREFEKGMRQSKKFFAMKDHSNEKALKRFDSQKGNFSGSGAEPDLGPVAGRDYEPFMPEGDEEVTWPSEEEIEDEEDSEGPHAAS